MLVSIIIPIYNVEPYIRQCLQSVMDQTLTEGLECILVDDCGQDKSMEIAQQMVDEYNGNIDFHIIHHEHNRGLSAARNTGIDAATGDYLYFLDSDDWISPECIQLMVEAVSKHPDTEIVFAGANVSQNKLNWLDYTKKQLPEYSNDKEWLQCSMLRRYNFGMTAWNKLISTKFIHEHNLKFAEGLIHEDELWNFELSKHIKHASFIPHNTYNYLIRENSITDVDQNKKAERQILLWNLMINSIDGHKKKLQVKAICRFIFVETTKQFPTIYYNQIAKLFFKLALRTSILLMPLYLFQGLLAFIGSSKYNNSRIRSRIALN